MKSTFDPAVMSGNLSRLCLEQFAEQGQLMECRDALYRIYGQLNGSSPGSFARQLTDVCDSISAAVNASALITEGLQMVARIRGIRKTSPDKELLRVQLKNLYAIDLDDYCFVCDSLAALGLTLYDPISFDDNGALIGGELNDCDLAQEMDRVSEMILACDSFSFQELVNGGRQRTEPALEPDDL